MFILAFVLRLGLPLMRESLFLKQPFILTGYHFYHHVTSDSIYYNYTAKALIEGKGYSMNYNELILENIDVGNLSVPTPQNEIIIDKWKIHKPNKIFLTNMADYGKWRIDDPNYILHRIIPPLYPIFLAICYWLFGGNTLAYFIPQIFLGSLTCLLIYFITKEIFDRKTAMLAGFAVALYPDLIFWTYMIRPETFYIFLLALSFLFLLRGTARNTSYLLYAGVLFLGFACLTRIVTLLFIPAYLFWQFIALGNSRKTWSVIATSFMILFITLLPWCIRNHLVFKQFSFFTIEQAAVLLDYTYNFSLNEFKDRSAVNKLLQAIDADDFGILFNGYKDPIARLNNLLDVPNFYDIWLSKNKTIAVSKKTQELIKATKNIRGKRFDKLSATEQNTIKHLNRLLLEITYPKSCPKGLFFANSYDLISSKSSMIVFADLIIKNPIEYSLITFKRMIKFLSPITSQMRDTAKYYRILTWLIVFPLSLLGIISAILRCPIRSGLLLLFIAFNILLFSATYVDDGLVYRYPIQPFLCIFAAYGLVSIKSFIWRETP